MYRVLIMLSIFLYGFRLSAQHAERALMYDSLTYALWYGKEWKPLLKATKAAHQEGIDLYYMNIRGAIAADALNKPFESLRFLNKAERDYPGDAYVHWMKMNAYLQTGQYAQALRSHQLMRRDSAYRIKFYKRPAIHMLLAEYGVKTCENDELYKQMTYMQVGFGHRTGRVSWFHAVSQVEQESYYGRMKQQQWYTSAAIALPHNFTFTPSVHVMQYQTDPTLPVPDTSKLKGTPWIAGLQTSYAFNNITLQGGYYYSTLNHETQWQIQPGIIWYPFSNNILSLQGNFNYLGHTQETTWSGSIAAMPHRRVNLMVSYLQAGTRYFSEQNGYLVNNSYDPTDTRLLGMASVDVYKLTSIYGIYMTEAKDEYVRKIAYTNSMWVAGIRQNF